MPLYRHNDGNSRNSEKFHEFNIRILGDRQDGLTNFAIKAQQCMGLFVEEFRCLPGACGKCSPYDEMLFMSGTGPQPPLHPNCRCERVIVDIDLDTLRSTGRLVKVSDQTDGIRT